MSPKIYTRVERIFLYMAGLSLNSDVAVPFLKSKTIVKNVFLFRVDAGVVPLTNQEPPSILIESPPYPTLGHGDLANVLINAPSLGSFAK